MVGPLSKRVVLTAVLIFGGSYERDIEKNNPHHLVLSLGIALIFLSAFLLRFLYKPWVVLILSLIGVIIIGLVIKHAGAKPE